MNVVGPSLDVSALQAVAAQQVASKARDREKAESASGRRFQDLVELRVGNVETADAVRGLPANDSEQGDQEREGRREPPAGYGTPADDGNPPPHIDITA